jgi:hypothetical protein
LWYNTIGFLAPLPLEKEGIMTLEGTVVNGTILLDQPAQLPEGARVEVRLKEQTGACKPTQARLSEVAGTVDDLPTGMARNDDRYLHGDGSAAQLSLVELDRLLDDFSAGLPPLPTLPADLCRADLHGEHD